MNTKPLWAITISFIFLFVSVGPVQAEMFIYPKEGQNKEKQEMDEFQCHKWAKQQSGSSPSSMSSQPAPAPQASNDGKIVRGGARGALLGAVGGAIGGDAGKGAKIGAGVGATAGLLKRRRGRIEPDAQQQAAAQVQQQSQAATGGYDRAYKVCLKGRGYEVE